jgi:hypothetical protein
MDNIIAAAMANIKMPAIKCNIFILSCLICSSFSVVEIPLYIINEMYVSIFYYLIRGSD